MNLFELFVKIGVDDQASGKIENISKNLKDGLTKAAKASATAIVALGTAAVKSYADFEQLAGGVETLFGKNATSVMKNAEKAYKTAGLSANEYMETVTSFSASLLQSLGGDTEKAAKYADLALTDMADNANKMGTSMEMIQNAYQGFAKQNYTMLDNLKLGYGGTKTEMERLISDAAKLDSSIQANDLSFSNIVKAINAVQTQMGITGTTALEAEKTISGSAASMKAAFSNFLTSLASDNMDTKESFEELKETTSVFLENLVPKIQAVFESIGPIGQAIVVVTGAILALSAAEKAFTVVKTAATAAQWLYNAALNANPIGLIITLVAGLVAAIVTLWNTNEGFRNALISAWEAIKGAAETIFNAVANFFTETIPNAFNSVIDWFKDIGKKFADIGKNIIDGIKKGISNAWNNLVKWFKGLFGDLIGIAKKILGIASPSKVFKKIGGFTAEGFGAGFEDEFAHVKDDMEDALNFDDASVGINASIRKVGAGVAGGAFGGTSIGNITINIDGAKYTDEQSLASAIALEIQNMTDRRAAVYA